MTDEPNAAYVTRSELMSLLGKIIGTGIGVIITVSVIAGGLVAWGDAAVEERNQIRHRSLEKQLDRLQQSLDRIDSRNGQRLENRLDQRITITDDEKTLLMRKQLLSSSEMAALEGVTQRTIWRRIDKGEYEATKNESGVWLIINPYFDGMSVQ